MSCFLAWVDAHYAAVASDGLLISELFGGWITIRWKRNPKFKRVGPDVILGCTGSLSGMVFLAAALKRSADPFKDFDKLAKDFGRIFKPGLAAALVEPGHYKIYDVTNQTVQEGNEGFVMLADPPWQAVVEDEAQRLWDQMEHARPAEATDMLCSLITLAAKNSQGKVGGKTFRDSLLAPHTLQCSA